ncbi:hypothetical protein [uncultured Jatrophihabitans sp.]|uniref:hypothetical protein n=1 Tax=uncultured Jatrophihabitans sp. TaxID=1610747 RepID=UPI0035CBEC43
MAVLAVGVTFGLRALLTTAKKHFVADSCTVGGYTVDPDQASVAATMVGAVTSYRRTLPERASVLALAAALQESKLTNLAPGDGDRDSVGVLQQRPSQGWGKVAGEPDTIAARTARLTDVAEATREFLAALVKISGWQTMPLAQAVQAVQISADGSAYAQHEPEAQALADALQGKVAAGITCAFAAPTEVALPRVVAAQARQQLGIDTPAPAGDTVRVPGAHWQTVAWFVANADRLGIEQVSYAGRTWTRPAGWRKDAKAAAAAVVATMYRKK